MQAWTFYLLIWKEPNLIVSSLPPMLEWYHVININKGIKEPTCEYQICNTQSNIWFLASMSRWETLCVFEFLFGSTLVWTILIPTAIILRYEGFLHVVYTRMASKKNIPKHPYFTGVKKKVKSSLNILKLFKTQDDIGATLVATDHLHEMSKDHTTPS